MSVTVCTPLNTVHGLTAGAAVVTGSKIAVNADIYGKASIANFSSALTGSYFKSIDAYNDALPKLTGVELSVEINKIQSIHATCTLAAAKSAIQKTITSPASAPAAPVGLTATASAGAVQLTWTAVDGASTFNVYQGSAPGSENVAPAASGITTNSYAVTGLKNNTVYY